MSSAPPTTTVVEKAAPKPVVVEEAAPKPVVVEQVAPKPVVVEQAPAPTAPVNSTIVEKTQPTYVAGPRRTAHKRWLIPFWLLQLGLYLWILILTGRALDVIRGVDTSFDADANNARHSTIVQCGLGIAFISFTILTVLIEIFLYATHTLHPLYHFLSSGLRFTIWLALLILAVLGNTHFYNDPATGKEEVYFHGNGVWLPAVLFLFSFSQTFYAAWMLGRHNRDKGSAYVDNEQVLTTSAPSQRRSSLRSRDASARGGATGAVGI